jgi:hypothetical protein
MAAKPPIIFAPAEMLDSHLDARMFQDFRENLGSGDHGLTNGKTGIGLEQQYFVELVRAANFLVAEINHNHIAFGNPVLPRSAFENRVHRSLRLAILCTIQKANIADFGAGDQSR